MRTEYAREAKVNLFTCSPYNLPRAEAGPVVEKSVWFSIYKLLLDVLGPQGRRFRMSTLGINISQSLHRRNNRLQGTEYSVYI